ncbi:MAG: hypothetical protein WC702_03910 [Patescibacteria group bacterium]
MKNFYKNILYPFYHAAGAVAYIVILTLTLSSEDFFGNFGVSVPDFLMMAFILMILVLSTAMMGILFFLKPILLYLDNKKKEGLWFLGMTVAWFVLIGAMMFLMVALLSR